MDGFGVYNKATQHMIEEFAQFVVDDNLSQTAYAAQREAPESCREYATARSYGQDRFGRLFDPSLDIRGLGI